MCCAELLASICQKAFIYDSLKTEAGTQEHLIEPVLRVLGWNLDDPAEMQRTVGNTRGEKPDTFDLLLFAQGKSKTPRIAIECKAIGNSEFRLPGLNDNGRLVQVDGKWDQPRQGKHQYQNRDGLAQLRRYCANRTRGYDPAYTIPVLTNGKQWVAFRGEDFDKNLDKPVAESACLFEPIRIDDPNFLRVIKEHLKK
jgi:hypothetical protein